MPFEKLLDPLLRRPETVAGPVKILLWWELRRLPFNLLVGVAGLVTVLAALSFAWLSQVVRGDPAGLWETPVFAGLFAVLYGLAANVFYTAGWVSEIVVTRALGRKAAFYGPVGFAVGTVLSVFLTLCPAVLLTFVMLASLVGAH